MVLTSLPPPTNTTTPSTSDPAYKKARRQFLKSTRNRSKGIEEQWTPFRSAEKKFKARFPPPDLSVVLDLVLLDEKEKAEVINSGQKGGLEETGVEWKEIEFGESQEKLSGRRKKAYLLPRIPGLVILPSFISHEEQRSLVRWSLRDHARQPNETNLDTHYVLPPEGLWNAYLHDMQNPVSQRIIQPRASTSAASISPSDLSTSDVPAATPTFPSPPGPRTLISNTPASLSTLRSLNSTPKFPYEPSPTVPPLSTSSLPPKLRWANIGWLYHWGTKQYDFSKGKQEIGEAIRNLCKDAVEGLRWEEVFGGMDSVVDGEGWGEGGPDWHTWKDSYEPDAGIVNFYQTKDTLMGHVDRSEVCATSPLVSISYVLLLCRQEICNTDDLRNTYSLGNAAVFLIGGLTRDTEPVPILLRSGDVLIMSGPACRRAYHGVPRILENSLPEHLGHASSSFNSPIQPNDNDIGEDEWAPYAEYMKTTRINVNVRQVFPKGFDPALELASKDGE